MNSEFEIKHINSRPILGVRVVTTMDKVPETIGPLFGEVYGFIRQGDHQPAGMPLTVYHAIDGNTIDLECGMPLTEPAQGKGRVTAGELAGGKVVMVTHMGPYEKLGQTWSALTNWIEAQQLEPRGSPWEVYQTDPGAEPDQSKWRTDIFFPVH